MLALHEYGETLKVGCAWFSFSWKCQKGHGRRLVLYLDMLYHNRIEFDMEINCFLKKTNGEDCTPLILWMPAWGRGLKMTNLI